MERKAAVQRKTQETDISVELELMSLKPSDISSGVPFFDHMLTSMSKHGRFYLHLVCKGDSEIDDHHSVEDIGIVLGQAFGEALGDKSGIKRFGNATIPMDEALALSAIDLSGRGHFHYTGMELQGYIAQYSEELTIEFLKAFALKCGMNLHIQLYYGENRHHIHEAIFKALGVSLYSASSIDDFLEGNILSTKGMIV
ncbi:MAG: imidazoleglycerol-phosphate dehydratase HisB [bacterium]|nr:imidazoleglycerol-phosphate dehydratase HisB [bacterium]